MKRSRLFTCFLFLSLFFVLYGCKPLAGGGKKGKNTPASTPETTPAADPAPTGAPFVRKHTGNDTYKDYTEIYFDGYQDTIKNAPNLTIYRRKAGEENKWEGIYFVQRSYDNAIGELQPLIDYYADPATKYEYKLYYEQANEYLESCVQTFTCSKGLGELQINQTNATYDSSTGLLTFEELPSYSGIVVNYFTDASLEFQFSTDHAGYHLDFHIPDNGSKQFNIANSICNDHEVSTIIGTLLKPTIYRLSLSKRQNGLLIYYTKSESISGIPTIDTSTELPSGEPFVRKRTSGGAYNNYVEIFFDNYTEKIQQLKKVTVLRRNGNSDWTSIYTINATGGSNFSDIAPVADYYTTANTEYQYRLLFEDKNGYSSSLIQRITPETGLGSISITKGEATYDSANGILTFSKQPSFSYTAINDGFNEVKSSIVYATSFVDLYLPVQNIKNSKLDVFECIRNNTQWERLLSTTITPSAYKLELRKTFSNYEIIYGTDVAINGLPDITTPASIPAPSFLRKHSGNDSYNGFVEVYFDNYRNQLAKSSILHIERKDGNSVWEMIYEIGVVWNSNLENFSTLSSELTFIDYYTDANTEYSYRFSFSKDGSVIYNSQEQSITATSGLGEIQVNQGAGTYNETTGKLTFSTIPTFNYTPVSEYFDSTDKILQCSYVRTPSWISGTQLDLSSITAANKILDVYRQVQQTGDKNDIIGNTLTPEYYYLSFRKDTNDIHIYYFFSQPVTSGELQNMYIPTEVMLSDNEKFVRTISGGQYDGYTEIFFDNYEEEIRKSNRIMIHRKKADGNWDYVFNIYTNWNGNTNPLFTDIPTSVIDFYTEEDTEYTYRLNFYYHNNSTGDHYDEYSPSQKIPVEKGLGEITVTQGIESSFDRDTGILTFSTVPDFLYTSVSGYFDRNYEYIEYSYPYETWTSQVVFSMENISENKLNIYNEIANGNSGDYARTIGKTITPRNYYLELTKDMENYSSSYQIDIPVTTGYLKSINIPDPLPDVPLPENEQFVRTHSGDEYNGYTEIYFDNYREEILNEFDWCIMRKEGDGDWVTIYELNNFPNNFTEVPDPLIDYYVVPGREYSYGLSFNWDTTQKNTAEAGLGEVNVTQKSATFDSDTGILTFTASPVFTYQPINVFFSNSQTLISFDYPLETWESSIDGVLTGNSNTLDVYQEIRKYGEADIAGMLGKPFTPTDYILRYCNEENSYFIRYDIKIPCTGIAPFVIPETLPSN